MSTPLVWYGQSNDGWAVGCTDPVVSMTVNLMGTEQEAKQYAVSMAIEKNLSLYHRIKAGRLRFEKSYS
jgi:hypothetical protein